MEKHLKDTLNTVFTEAIKEKGLENKIFVDIKQNNIYFFAYENKQMLFFIALQNPNTRVTKYISEKDILFRTLEKARKNGINYCGICNFLYCNFYDCNEVSRRKFKIDGLFKKEDKRFLSLHKEFIIDEEKIKIFRRIAKFYVSNINTHVIKKQKIKVKTFNNLCE